MILPVVKLGTLALKTFCKPFANRLKKEAGLHPRFASSSSTLPRQFLDYSSNFKDAYSLVASLSGKDYLCMLDGHALIASSFCFCTANHQFTTRMQRRIYGHATDVAIHPLDEEKAVQAAADLLGELFVFTVAGAAVIFEVQRSSRSEARKEELRKQELEAMKQREEDLAQEVELLKKKIEELEQLARGRGFVGLFNFRHSHGAEDGKAKPS
ncbi:hypothetical protein CRYUN_Cryun18bG0049200 [Craigia yunnanensis]